MLVHCMLFQTFLHHRSADVTQLVEEPSRLWLHEDSVCKCMLLGGSPLANATCACMSEMYVCIPNSTELYVCAAISNASKIKKLRKRISSKLKGAKN